jgi:hypothetical protein
MDVAFMVKKTQYVGPNYTRVRGWWVSVAYSCDPFKLTGMPETIVITKENMPRWNRINVVVTDRPW